LATATALVGEVIGVILLTPADGEIAGLPFWIGRCDDDGGQRRSARPQASRPGGLIPEAGGSMST
jgi:hypothetical protein